MQTERLLLREFQSSDLDQEHEYAADPQVSQFAPWGPNTYEQTRRVLNDRLEEQRRWPRDEVTLAIEHLEDRRLIGAIRLTIVSHADRSADFGYVLNRKYWNAGYATEAARAVLDCAFANLGLHRVYATCDTRNVASLRVLEKLSMRREAHFRRDMFQKGGWRDTFLFARLEGE